MSRRWIGAFALASAVLASACDSGPEGPGTRRATVTAASPVGAAVIELYGGGVQGIEAQGGTQVYSARLGSDSTAATLYRVVVVSETGTDVRFGIRVSDRAAAAPAVTVVSAVDGSNAPMAPGGLTVHIER